jgi:hypothetical protein
MPDLPGPIEQERGLLQHIVPRLLRAAIPVALASAFLLAPLAGGGGFSGRNGGVIYLADTNVINTDESPELVTDASDADTNPGLGASLSPNAESLAYTRGTPPTRRVHVHCFSTCSDTDLALGSSQPSWSPDGTKIAYVADATGQIEVSKPDGTDVVVTGAIGAEPAWSPDGTKIAFASPRGTGLNSHFEIWTVTPALLGTQVQVTGSLASNDRQPAWSPDGSQIAFHSDRSGTNQIYVVPAGGGSFTQLTSDANASTSPVWSPNGSLIAFTRSSQVYKIAASGGTPMAVAGTAGVIETADWKTLRPENTSAPTVSSSDPPVQGQSVAAAPGTWDGASSYSYQWLRCGTDGNGCSNSGGPTSSSSYTLTSGDVGLTIRVDVTASNSAGGSVAVRSSNFTAVVIGPGPTNKTLPSITGTARVGNTLSASVGSWTGSGNTYSYQWKKCDPATTSCFDLRGANSSFFTITGDLYGWQLRVMVTAKNADGTASANSAPTATVVADPPVNISRPTVSGLNIVGETLFAGVGSWTGSSPITYTYQWKRCNPQGTPASCVSIAGATSSTYVLTAAESGVTVRVYVTARNAAGGVEAFSDHTFPTLPAGSTDKTTLGRPASSALPRIVGTPTTGATLTANAGTWTGQTPIAYRYAWRRCDATGAACKRVAGATRRTYLVRAADVGFTLRVAVVARNAAGAASALSAPSDTVQLSKPVPRGRHVVGTRGADYLPGGGGNDFIEGRAGNDTLLGGAGNDRLVAGAGNDVIDGGSGADRVDGGAGSDTVRAADGSRDRIDCGDGRDHAVVDRDDVVTGCELVTFGTTPTPTPTPEP